MAAVGRAIGAALVFTAALVLGVVLHSETPAMRRLVLAGANRAVAGAFAGDLRVAGMRRFGIGVVDGVDLVVRDPQGRVVATAEGVRARVRLLPLVRSLARRGGPLWLVLSEVRVASVDVTLIRGADGNPTIAHAFDPAHPSSGPSRAVVVDVRSLRIARAAARGQAASVEDLDATVSRVNGSFFHGPSGTRGDVLFDLRVLGVLPRAIAGTLSARADLPADAARSAEAAVDVDVGGLPVALRASLRGERLVATLASHAGEGKVEARADADLRATRTAHVSIVADRFEPRRALASAPEGTVSARAEAEATLRPDGEVSGDATLHGEGRLGSEDVPPIDVRAHFTREQAFGAAHVEEPGAPVEVTFDARYAGQQRRVDFDARARAPDLARVRRLPAAGLRGAALGHAAGRVDLARRVIEGTLDARLTDFAFHGGAARRAQLRARVSGELADPEGDVSIRAEGVTAAGRRLDQVDVDARGRARAPTVSVAARGPGVPTVRARAALSFARGVTAQGMVVDASNDGASASARVDRLHVGGGHTDLVGVAVSGLGDVIRGELHVSPRTTVFDLNAPRIDLDRVGALLGRRTTRGTASADVAVRLDPRGVSGHVRAAFDTTSIRGVGRGVGRVGVELAGRNVDGGLQLDLDDLHARATLSDVVLDGAPNRPGAWKRARGSLKVQADLGLETLRRVLPQGVLPFDRMRGRLTLVARAARATTSGLPDLSVDVSTQGLVLVGRGEVAGAAKPSYVAAPEQATAPKLPWETRDADVRLSAALDGASSRVSVSGTVFDRAGTVLSAHLEGRPPLEALWRDRADARRLLEHVPIEAHVEAPSRDISRLPPLLRPAALRGSFSATLDVHGEVVDPRVHLNARAAGVTSMQSRSALPFDGSVDGTYDGSAAIVRAILARPEGVVLDARAYVDARIAQVLGGQPGGAAWDAGATVALHGFPLEGIPQIATRGVGGRATGVVTVDGLHRDARLEADVQIEQPRLGVVCFRDGSVRVTADGGRLAAAARFEDPRSFADVRVDAASRWGADPAPSIDTSQPIDLALKARDFRAAALMPFVEGVFNQLDGHIDADAAIHVDPDFKTGTMSGDVRLSKGIVEVPSLGEQLHDVSARVSIRPWGTLRVDDVSASGATGKLTASAIAMLDGIKLRTATADVDIPRDGRMPLTVEGVALGEASGHVHAQVSMAPDQSELDVKVEVPKLEVSLPQSTGRAVQSLEPAPHVLIGMYETGGRFVVLPLHAPERPREAGSLKIHAVVQLGSEVRVRRDSTLDVQLAGAPVIDVTDQAHISGTIHVTHGTVEVFGKRFTIDPASTVSFTGDSSNPQLVVRAEYRAPDETRIFADVVGPLKDLSVKLSSEPQRTQDEMLGLLLFGSEQGLGGTPPPDQQPDPTQRAAGLASGIVTQGINKALSGITSVEIATRVDTSQAANPRPEVEVRITNDVLANVTVNTGMPAPGEPPDRTLLTVDWRFRPRWSLAATVGDQGSTFLDLFWRHRY